MEMLILYVQENLEDIICLVQGVIQQDTATIAQYAVTLALRAL